MRQYRAKKAMPRDEVSKEEDAPRGRRSKSGGGSKSGRGTRRGGETNEIGGA
jgi:hypothetical protein